MQAIHITVEDIQRFSVADAIKYGTCSEQQRQAMTRLRQKNFRGSAPNPVEVCSAEQFRSSAFIAHVIATRQLEG